MRGADGKSHKRSLSFGNVLNGERKYEDLDNDGSVYDGD